MYNHLYVSLFDYQSKDIWVYRIAIAADKDPLVIQSMQLPVVSFGQRANAFLNASLAVYGDHLWVAGEREVIRIKLDDFSQLAAFTHYDLVSFTEIIPTDGGTLLATRQGQIHYLNPFGEFFHLRDLTQEHQVCEGMVPISIRPPLTLFLNRDKKSSLTHFPYVLYNSDDPHNYVNLSVSEACNGLVYHRDKIGVVDGQGFIKGYFGTEFEIGTGVASYKHIDRSNPCISTVREIPKKNAPTESYLITTHGYDLIDCNIDIVQKNQLVKSINLCKLIGNNVNVLDVVVDPRDKWQ